MFQNKFRAFVGGCVCGGIAAIISMMAGCNTVRGICADIGSATDAVAGAATNNKQAEDEFVIAQYERSKNAK